MFSVSIEQSTLMKALEYLEPTVGKNSTGQGDNCIGMRTTGNGSMEMYTTNTLEFTKLEAIVAMGGSTQEVAPHVDFKRFKTIISSIPSYEIVSLEANVNDLLINFSLKKTPLKLVGCTTGMMSLPNVTAASPVTIPIASVKTATDNVCSIITNNANTPIYDCMRIYTNNIDIEVTAIDVTGKRTFVQLDTGTTNNPTQEILLEAHKFKKSLKLFEDYRELEFYMTQNMVLVAGADIMPTYYQKTKGMIDNVCYYARRLSGAFPTNIRANFKQLPTEFAEIGREELLNCFTRVKAIEDQTSGGLIGFEANKGNVVVTLNSAYGNIEDSIATENSIVKTFKTVFKYDNLSDIMKVMDSDTFKIGVMPNHPNSYVIKSKGSNGSAVMFTVSGMVTATP